MLALTLVQSAMFAENGKSSVDMAVIVCQQEESFTEFPLNSSIYIIILINDHKLIIFIPLLDQVAKCYKKLNDYVEATRTYKYALTLAKTFPSDIPENVTLLIRILEPIINLYRKRHMFDQAFHHCHEALALYEKKGIYNHIHTCIILHATYIPYA